MQCTYDPESKNGTSSDGRKVKGVIHWVSAKDAIEVDVRLFDNLFLNENADDVEEGKTFMDYINPNSLVTKRAFIEPSLAEAKVGDSFQFERVGYFTLDSDSKSGDLIFNRTVGLKDSWAKINVGVKK